MDFWSRLIGGAGSSPSTKQTRLNQPQQRLNLFKQIYNKLLQLWHNGDIISRDRTTAENVCTCLHRLAELLNDDLRGPAPHLCIAFAANSRLLILASRLASSLHNHGVIHEALGLCSLLIDSEEEDFLEDRGFAIALMLFIESITSSGPLTVDVDTEGVVVEVLFSIASRIRLQPEILPVWFVPESSDEDVDNESNASIKAARKAEFPLFYILLDYVHYEGRAGEFARMGLLYIIEAAAHSEELEKWIIESDLATLMASGLGALYSQLSRKVVSSYARDEIPVILALSGSHRAEYPSDAEETSSPNFQSHLNIFLAYLVFWQDVLEHCTSMEVKRTLLDHFQFLFLEQLLYPSLLESSDIDGGSSVAVLTYLRCILESIDHPDLIDLTMQYLLALQDRPLEPDTPARPTTLARRRKSQSLMTHLQSTEDRPSPVLFNLVDMVLSSLPSRNQQTATATLRLLSIILRRQHRYAMSTLLKTKSVRALDEARTAGAHNKEVNILLALAEDLGNDEGLEDSYQAYLYDNRSILENHLCSAKLLEVPGAAPLIGELQASLLCVAPLRSVAMHTITLEDPLFKSLTGLLQRFFSNDIEVNLALTQAIVDLASCGFNRLEGWLLVHPSNYLLRNDCALPLDEGNGVERIVSGNHTGIAASESYEEEQLRALRHARQEPSWLEENTSPIFAALDSLVQQIDTYRRDVQEFDKYLTEHRQLLRLHQGKNGTTTQPPDQNKRLADSKGTSPSPARNAPQIRSISERLQVEKTSGPESRSSSPRGRRQNSLSAPTLVGRLSHLHASPSRSTSQSTSRTYSPSPLRKDPLSSTPPKPRDTSMAIPTVLQRKIRVTNSPASLESYRRAPTSSETSSVRSASIGPEGKTDELSEITLGHLLTNVVILQEFILELAALIEIRAGLFGEVRFV